MSAMQALGHAQPVAESGYIGAPDTIRSVHGMITRYTRPEMGRIWSEENKYKQWLEVELAASEALAEIGRSSRRSCASAASARPDGCRSDRRD